MDGVVPVVVEDRESLDSLCGEKDDLENEMIRVKAEAPQKEEEKAKGEDSFIPKFHLHVDKVLFSDLFMNRISTNRVNTE